MSHEAVICFGSNVPGRDEAISLARSLVETVATTVAVSPAHVSADICGRGCDYLNVAVRCATDLTLEGFSAKLAEFERLGGRTSDSKASGIMPIDIDIVIWDGIVISPSDYSRPYFRQCLAGL